MIRIAPGGLSPPPGAGGQGETPAAPAPSLYERLRANDFKHVEDGIGDGLAVVNTRLDGIDSRLDRMDSRARDERAAMEARILEAVRSRPGEPPE